MSVVLQPLKLLTWLGEVGALICFWRQEFYSMSVFILWPSPSALQLDCSLVFNLLVQDKIDQTLVVNRNTGSPWSCWVCTNWIPEEVVLHADWLRDLFVATRRLDLRKDIQIRAKFEAGERCCRDIPGRSRMYRTGPGAHVKIAWMECKLDWCVKAI